MCKFPVSVCIDMDGDQCDGKSNGNYAKCDDCDHFVMCYDLGEAYEVPCAFGTIWNDESGLCDWEYNVALCDIAICS